MGRTDKIMGLWGGTPGEIEKVGAAASPPTETTSLKGNLQEGTNYLKRQGAKLVEITQEGPLSFRILAFLGGIGMIVASIIDVVQNIVVLSLPGLLIAFYAFCFGVMICVIEGRGFEIPESMQRTAKFYFRVIDYTWGRGLIYAFAGSLLLTQPSHINCAVGFFMMFVGIVALISSAGAGRKLTELRFEIDSKRDLKRLFQEHDFDRNGGLKVAEFASLCADLGVEVTYQELVACFNAIDKNDDERISYDELTAWWTQWGSKHLHRSLSDLMV